MVAMGVCQSGLRTPQKHPGQPGGCKEKIGTSIQIGLRCPLNFYFCECLIIHAISVLQYTYIIYKQIYTLILGVPAQKVSTHKLYDQEYGENVLRALEQLNPLIC